jgi:hypothetical protein
VVVPVHLRDRIKGGFREDQELIEEMIDSQERVVEGRFQKFVISRADLSLYPKHFFLLLVPVRVDLGDLRIR